MFELFLENLASIHLSESLPSGQGMGFICGVLLMYMGEDDATLAVFDH